MAKLKRKIVNFRVSDELEELLQKCRTRGRLPGKQTAPGVRGGWVPADSQGSSARE